MNKEISFEIAKLLKEKGFDNYCDKKYVAKCLWQSPNNREKYKNSEIHKNSSDVSAPTIAEVCMWLYEKYGIWISVIQNEYEDKFQYTLTQRKPDSWCVVDNGKLFNSPTEAYEAAIEYTLTNLI